MSYNNSIYSDEFNDHNESQSLEVQEEENYTYIERDIRDPSPTLSVPFKIIKNKSKQYDDYNRGSYSPKDIRKNNESMQQPAQQSISYDDIDNDSDSDSDSDWMSTNYDQW
ncbi:MULTISPECIES: hypothetical protein [unclassified Prochlorococcus]|nr:MULTISPECIES: hypothetical protein [unclassified Prochlorococcus]